MRTATLERAAALAILFGTLTSCGQRGPLSLPDSARPIEALPSGPAPPAGERAAAPAAGSAIPVPPGAAGTTPPTQREPGSEDEPSDERSDRDEPEREREP